MKRFLLLLLSLIMIAGLCACSDDSKSPDTYSSPAAKDGDLIISVDSDAAKKGIAISENEDGSDHAARLYADMVDDVSNTTYDWLPATLDMEAYGSHNGKNYMAYTFSVANHGSETVKYTSTLKVTEQKNDVDEAVRIMVFRNGEPAVFAKENITDKDGNLPAESDEMIPFETLYKKVIPENYTAPSDEEIKEAAKDQNKNPVETTDERLPITLFVDDNVVFSNYYTGLEPGKSDKYTIVMWIEGEDPECIEGIRAGYVKLEWYFSLDDEEL